MNTLYMMAYIMNTLYMMAYIMNTLYIEWNFDQIAKTSKSASFSV